MPTSVQRRTLDEHRLVHQPSAVTHSPAHLHPCPTQIRRAIITITSRRLLPFPPLFQRVPTWRPYPKRRNGHGANLFRPSSLTSSPTRRRLSLPLSRLHFRRRLRLRLPSNSPLSRPSPNLPVSSRGSQVGRSTLLASRHSRSKPQRLLMLSPALVCPVSGCAGCSVRRATWACS